MKYLQERRQTSVHWFDPFGSVEFADIKNSHAIHNKNRDAKRYLFWDQEPVDPELFKQFADQFTPIYDGDTTLITSERDSTNVQWACDTYGLRSAYYFFHGWAALDWFRGYNHSFLMRPYNKRRITKTFIMPNRIIAGQRQHRLIMLYHIFRYGMQDNHISCPAVCPAENITVEEAVKEVFNKYPDVKEVFNKQQFPMQFAGETDAPMDSFRLSLFDESAESLLYLVTETVATGRRQHLTEKTFKPICLKMPFMIVGTQGSLAYLRSYGFRTFGHLWDESYDNELHEDQRIEKLAFTLKAMDILPADEKQRLFDMAQEVCEHNYNHFYNGGFERVLWEELQGMLNGL